MLRIPPARSVRLRHLGSLALTTSLLALFPAGCNTVPDGDDPAHPKDIHEPLPPLSLTEGVRAEGHIPSGVIRDEVVEQPIAFTHHRHVVVLGMDCQYCHADVRRSPKAGVPAVEVCMGCHEHVFTESPEIQKVAAYWEAGDPIPWNRVHDLPAYVHFDHSRHVQGGVECTECHGQVPLMGQWPDGDPARAEVMWREASLQMGWCLDCHGDHPSIDQNYGDHADLRRAELKDCWACHK